MTEDSFWSSSNKWVKTVKSFWYGDLYGTDSENSSDNDLRVDFEDEIKNYVKVEIDSIH